MFASIAPRYDLLNRLLSLGCDQRWRRELVRCLPALQPGQRALDLCTGTGDVALAMARAHPEAHVHASDFCEEMLVQAPAKGHGSPVRPAFFVSDALCLPYPDDCFAAVTVAFGLRNVEDPGRALGEMARILVPGGRLLVLEFSRPGNSVFAGFYRAYFFHILPLMGRLLSGSSIDAYRYLPESVWAFPQPSEVAAEMARRGLLVRRQRQFLGGAVVLHEAERVET